MKNEKIVTQEYKPKTYKVGDVVNYLDKQYKIVEILDNGDFHLKNLEAPYDSFLTLLPKE